VRGVGEDHLASAGDVRRQVVGDVQDELHVLGTHHDQGGCPNVAEPVGGGRHDLRRRFPLRGTLLREPRHLTRPLPQGGVHVLDSPTRPSEPDAQVDVHRGCDVAAFQGRVLERLLFLHPGVAAALVAAQTGSDRNQRANHLGMLDREVNHC
jgi:hypothetical protein